MTGAYTPSSGLRRTLFGYLGAALGVVPLCALLRDRGWLIDVWLSMLVVLLPAMLMRLRRPPGALQIWPGIVLLVPWLTARFVPEHAWLGLIPSGRTWQDVGALLDDLHSTMRDGVAPVHSTVAIRLSLCAMLGLLAALVDLIAVVGRHGALAGVPLLAVFTVAGAVRRHGVSWPLFVFPAIGFLLLLAQDAQDDLTAWGHRVSRSKRLRDRAPAAAAGQRIAVIALIAAVVLPVFAPTNASNLIANLLHNKSGGLDNGFGAGGGSIDPFVALRGQLVQTRTQTLARVDVTGDAEPFYLRENVLSRFTGDGWVPAGRGAEQDVDGTDFGTSPATGQGPVQRFTARIAVVGLDGNPVLFANPSSVSGLGGNWTPQDQLVLGAKVTRGQTYTEEVNQPAPSVSALQASGEVSAGNMAEWLTLPAIPDEVRGLVTSLTRNKSGPYARARAISDFFADPANGFTYSLQTTAGDSGSDLVDFLRNRTGYCQQYAATMAVMLRLAQVPARVVLGYTHQAVHGSGSFAVTTSDAHAWVEAYFAGLGWVPFDPTPLSGADAGRASALPWAPHNVGNGSTSSAAPRSPSKSAGPTHRAGPGQSSGSRPASAAVSRPATDWSGIAVPVGVLVVLLGAALSPWFTRARRRKQRLRAAGAGDPDPLWEELSDTAVDLGYVWSPARSPRQVARWLGDPAGDARPALLELARAVERHRYGTGTPGPERDLTADLAAVSAALRAGRDPGARWRATLWPASLRWSPARWREALRRRH